VIRVGCAAEIAVDGRDDGVVGEAPLDRMTQRVAGAAAARPRAPPAWLMQRYGMDGTPTWPGVARGEAAHRGASPAQAPQSPHQGRCVHVRGVHAGGGASTTPSAAPTPRFNRSARQQPHPAPVAPTGAHMSMAPDTPSTHCSRYRRMRCRRCRNAPRGRGGPCVRQSPPRRCLLHGDGAHEGWMVAEWGSVARCESWRLQSLAPRRQAPADAASRFMHRR
jgi:hypothetical protein